MLDYLRGAHVDSARVQRINTVHSSGLPGPKKLKRQNLAMSSFKKGQILKKEKKAK